jgi:PAS domain S-box-containing protein
MPTTKNIRSHASDIIIIDDEIRNLKLMAQLLTEQGYKARSAENPQMAIDSALMHPPALILLDVKMPQMDGFEVCRRLKQDERTRDIPIIFISALKDVQDRVRGFEAGGVDFISKPFHVPEVLARVRTHMELRDMQLNLKEIISERTAELEDEIGERKQAEAKIRQSEEKFKGVFNSMVDVFARADLEGKCLLISPSVFNVVGYVPEEIMGRNFAEFYTRPKERELFIKRLMETGSVWNYELEIKRKGGNRIIISSNAKVINNDSGQPICIESVFRDVTATKKVAESLLISEKKYRDLVDNSLVGVFNSSLDGKLLFVNDALAMMYDFDSPEHMLAEGSLPRWVDPKKREQLMSDLQEHGSVSNFEAESITATGRNIHVLFSVKLQDEVIAGMVMDITERKQGEKKILDHQQRLKALASDLTVAEEQERRRIATDLHDNVGQSLALSLLQLAAAENSVDNSAVKGQFDEISKTLLSAVQDTQHLIFELSSPTMNEFGLGAAISEWVELKVNPYHDIKVTVVDNHERKRLDQDQNAILLRSVRELLTNILKHSKADNATVLLEPSDGATLVTVQDNGIGFDPERVRRNVSPDGGLGLFSIEERLSDFGGSLVIDSKVHQGTTIVMMVPYLDTVKEATT